VATFLPRECDPGLMTRPLAVHACRECVNWVTHLYDAIANRSRGSLNEKDVDSVVVIFVAIAFKTMNRKVKTAVRSVAIAVPRPDVDTSRIIGLAPYRNLPSR
jgi:hypothetical protein